MVVAYLTVTGLSVLAWIPILMRFYRSWVKRSNPISLGICAAILLLIWTSAAGIWEVTGSVKGEVVVLVSTSMSFVVALYCHVAFRLAERLFDDPSKPPKET